MKTYFSSTSAPASVSLVFISSAASLDTPSFTGFGALSTSSFASFRPRPVISLTALITAILLLPAEARIKMCIRDSGYRGLIHGEYRVMQQSDFSGILTLGGTILGTSRQPFKQMRVIGEDNIDKVKMCIRDRLSGLAGLFFPDTDGCGSLSG